MWVNERCTAFVSNAKDRLELIRKLIIIVKPLVAFQTECYRALLS